MRNSVTGSVRHIADESHGVFAPTLDQHFLADRSLSIRKTASLLLSSSFGANAILYASFLGYLMGLWALIIQAAWTISFYLLALFSPQVYESTSLHEFLGRRFGLTTRRIAAMCSVIGILYFAGWEIAVARTSLSSIIGSSHSHGTANLVSIILIAFIALVATTYTVIWGRRGNGRINLAANGIKILALISLTILLAYSVLSNNFSSDLFLPKFSVALSAIGIIGLITNLVLNFSWQLIDNSSWQSFISSVRKKDGSQKSLHLAGVVTLLTVNGLGTLLGILLRNNSTVSSDNILGVVVQSSTTLHIVALSTMFGLLLLSAMTLIDGAMLSVAQTITVDLRNKLITPARVTLKYARVATLIVALLISFGVNLAVTSFGGSIFDFVYIFIIAQLSLLGAVLVGLLWPTAKIKRIWIAVILGLCIGFGAAIFGTIWDNQNLVQAAGSIAAGVSVIIAFGLAILSKNR